jgi:heme exporter protein D
MEDHMKFDRGTSAAMSATFEPRDESQKPDTRETKPGNTQRNERTNQKSRADMLHAKNGLDLAGSKEFKLQELAMLSLTPIVRTIQRWWLHRAEQHYLICADVEQQRAREAQMNVAYYQKRAALARSARN